MDMTVDTKIRSQMRNYVIQRLRMKGDGAPLGDDDLLFTSGRLDSLDAIEIIMTIETDYPMNFSEIDFDLTRLDSITAIADLIDRQPS
jgi:acyl carrier protein